MRTDTQRSLDLFYSGTLKDHIIPGARRLFALFALADEIPGIRNKQRSSPSRGLSVVVQAPQQDLFTLPSLKTLRFCAFVFVRRDIVTDCSRLARDFLAATPQDSLVTFFRCGANPVDAEEFNSLPQDKIDIVTLPGAGGREEARQLLGKLVELWPH
jgi:hypothetical protein